MNKLRFIFGVLAILAVLAFVWFICVSSISITPADTKIVDILYENEEDILRINGVVGAGIARDENNYITGIAVYVEDNITEAQKQRIPNELGEFQVFIVKISEASEFEKEKMIICAYEPAETGVQIEFQTIEKGYYSGHREPAYYIVQSEAEWKDLWNKHAGIISPKPVPPNINFSESTVIAVFMGERRTGGYGIEIKEIVDTESSIIVKVEETRPGEGCVVTQAFTQPYHMVKVNKIDKSVRFEVTERVSECADFGSERKK